MKKRRVVSNRVLSLLLTICMVFTLLPAMSPATVNAAVSDKYQVAGTFLDMDGVTTGADDAWEWNGSQKTLTFKERVNLMSEATSGYKSAVLGLPAGTTIVMGDGVLVKLTSHHGDGIYCEGDLTIKGNGSLEVYGSNEDNGRDGNSSSTGYAGDDDKIGTAIACNGRLTVGEDGKDATTPYIYLISQGYSAHIIEILDASRSGEDNPAVALKSGQVQIAAYQETDRGKIWTAAGANGYVKLTNESVLQYQTKNEEACKLKYGKEGTLMQGFFYGTDANHRYVNYNANGGSEVSKVIQQRVRIGSKVDLTVTAKPPTGKVFMGWSTEANGAILKDEYRMPEGEISTGITLYAIYAEQLAKPTASLNYKDSKLTGLTANAEYLITVDGQEKTEQANGSGEISVTLSDLYGKEIQITAKGNGTTTTDSEQQAIKVSAKDTLQASSFSIAQATKGATDAKVSGITSAYQYRIDGQEWKTGDGNAVSVPAEKKIEIFRTATETRPESNILELTMKAAQTQEDKPAAGVDFRRESKLTGLKPGAHVVRDKDNNVIGSGNVGTDGNLVIPDLYKYAGQSISVVKSGNNDTTYDSQSQSIPLPDRGPAPERSKFELIDAGDGETQATIKGIENGYEYSEDGGKTWTDGNGSDVKVPAGTEVLIRESATQDKPESLELTIPTAGARTQEVKPNAGVDYAGSKLTNLVAGAGYIVKVDGETIADQEAGEDQTLVIENLTSYCEKTLEVIKKGDGKTTYNSEPQEIDLLKKGDAPSAEDFEVVEATGGETDAVIKNIPKGYEYSTDNGEHWTDGDGKDITVPAGTDVLIRVKATEDKPESESVTIPTKDAQTREETPDPGVNYKKPALTNLDPNGAYKVTVNGEVIIEDTADEEGNLVIENLSDYCGEELEVVKKGNEDTTYDSEPGKITLLDKGEAPSAEQFPVEDASEGETDAVIKNIPVGYEYSKDNGENWTDGDGNDITVPAGTEVLIRKKATDDEPESEFVKIPTKDALNQEKTPEAGIDYPGSRLTNLDPEGNYEITVDGQPIAEGKPNNNGRIVISNLVDYEDKEIKIVKKGDGETTYDSEPQTIRVPKREDAPAADLFPVVAPVAGETEGTVKNVGKDYEYSLDNGASWTDGDGSDVKVPAGGNILIRKKATSETLPSKELTIPIAPPKTQEDTPNIKADYTTEKLAGFVPNAAYEIKVDGKTISFQAATDGKEDLTPYYGKTIIIVKKGNQSTTLDSAEQSVAVIAKTAAPDEDQFKIETSGSGNVTIKNITSDFEYSTNNGSSWTQGNGQDVTVPAGTMILIRRKATALTPASNTVLIAAGYEDMVKVDQQITSANTDKGDVAGSTFAPLCLKATGKSKSVKLTWKKMSGASGYIIYGSACGKNNKMKKLTSVAASKKSYTVKKLASKKLKANTYYKFMIVAYKTINGKDYVMSKSKVTHASTTSKAKYGNPKKMKVKASKLSVKRNKKKTIKATLTLTKPKMKKHIAKFRYESADTKIATVTKKGAVKGMKPGKTYVYVYAQNGIYKRITVTVK